MLRMTSKVQLAACVALLMAASSFRIGAAQCDPLAELQKASTKDASLAFNMLTSLGLMAPGSLPQSGLTIFLSSDASLKILSKQLPGGGKDVTPAEAAASWAKLPKEMQDRLVSVLLYHITSSAYITANKNPSTIPTALSLVHPGFTMELLDSGTTLKTGAGQKVKLGAPIPVCGNFAYVVPQLLMPTGMQQLPQTDLQQALAVVKGLSAKA